MEQAMNAAPTLLRHLRQPLFVAAWFAASTVEVCAQDTVESLRSQNGGVNGGHFGHAVAKAGDFDGDGIEDFLISAHDAIPAGKKLGAAGIVYLMSGATGAVLQKYDGPRAPSEMGWDVASGQDFDADGTIDFITSTLFSHVVRVYSVRNATLLYNLSGESGGSQFGSEVFTVGDIDGDAVGDFGATGWGPVDPTLYVYSGKTGTLVYKWKSTSSGSPSMALYTAPTGLPDLNGDGRAEIAVGAKDAIAGWEVDILDGATGTLYYTISDPTSGGFASFGDHIGLLGDLDGDGFDDIAIGDTTSSTLFLHGGCAYAFSSGSGAKLFEWDGEASDAGFGVVAKDGRFDFNGDGIPDILIGSPNPPSFPPPLHNRGWSYAFSGRGGTLLYKFTGYMDSHTGEGEALGSSVTPVGDVNGDNLDDILVGGPAYQDPSYWYGQAYVFAGNDLFLQADASTYVAGQSIEIDTRGGVPWAMELLAAIDVNGAAQFTVVDLEFLDQNGDYALIDTVPSGLQGLDVTFQAFATRPPRKGLADSSTITLSFQ
jgi:hypothetical protein